MSTPAYQGLRDIHNALHSCSTLESSLRYLRQRSVLALSSWGIWMDYMQSSPFTSLTWNSNSAVLFGQQATWRHHHFHSSWCTPQQDTCSHTLLVPMLTNCQFYATGAHFLVWDSFHRPANISPSNWSKLLKEHKFPTIKWLLRPSPSCRGN